jgi:hypothetical protein
VFLPCVTVPSWRIGVQLRNLRPNFCTHCVPHISTDVSTDTCADDHTYHISHSVANNADGYTHCTAHNFTNRTYWCSNNCRRMLLHQARLNLFRSVMPWLLWLARCLQSLSWRSSSLCVGVAAVLNRSVGRSRTRT